MEGIGLQLLGWIIAVCLVAGLIGGYLIGHFFGGSQHQTKAAERAAKAHEEYRSDVHAHFEHTSQIMSRMVDDYREMYEHLSEGAGKLANIHPQRVVTPPPAPEAITAQHDADDKAHVDDTGLTDHQARSAHADEDDKARARRLSGNPT